MNYFELYDQPINLHIDKIGLKKKYFELSKTHHPDNNMAASQQQKSTIIQSMDVNDGYKILSNIDLRIKYMLVIFNSMIENEKYSLQPSFLLNVMDINEGIMDLEGSTENNVGLIKDLTILFEEQFTRLQLEIEPLFTIGNWTIDNQSLLSKLKEFYYKQKYLLRIKEKLDTFASR
jgi:molecular chaperone HscB